MKKLLYILFCISAFSLSGCSTFQKEIDELYSKAEELRLAEEDLQAQIDGVNDDMKTLTALILELQAGGYIKSMTPFNDENGVEAGYLITLSNGESFTIKHGDKGADAVIPVISAKLDTDGFYYWTVDGEFLTDLDGNRVRTDGITPKLEIREDNWYVSYDNGESWNLLGPSVGAQGKDGNPGSQVFQSLEYVPGTNVVKFILMDGTELVLPCYQPISITLDIEGNTTSIATGETIKVNYTLSYGNENTMVTVSSDGNYSAEIVKNGDTSGSILITCPGLYKDGHVNVIVFDGIGYASVAVINFYEKKILLSGGTVYHFSVDGGYLSIPVSYNSDFYAEVSEKDAEWIQIVKTKGAAMQEGTLEAVILKNEDDSRVGYINLYTNNTNGTPYTTIEIHQDAAYFEISEKSLIFTAEGSEKDVTVQTSRGIIVETAESWLTVRTEEMNGTDKYKIYVKTTENTTSEVRRAIVDIKAGNGTSLLSQVEVVQLQQGASDKTNLIFEAKASVANDYTVFLPIRRYSNKLNCVVEWGDGQVETYQHEARTTKTEGIYHTYSVFGQPSQTFEITVKGIVTELCSTDIPVGYRSAIVSVKQWGNTGLKNMTEAFYKNTSLTTLAVDSLLAFNEVESFSKAFEDCPKLTNIKAGLFNSTGKVTDFSYVFKGCSSLVEIPAGLFKESGKALTFESAFEECIALSSVSDSVFVDAAQAGTFKNCFKGCESILSISESAFKNCSEVTDFSSAFESCSKLLSVPEELFADCQKVTTFERTFADCRKIEELPDSLFASCPQVESFNSTFSSCRRLTTVPKNIFDENVRVSDFGCTFENCVNLEGESPYKKVNAAKVHIYERVNYPDYFVTPTVFGKCFYGANLLSDYRYMPESWKE